MKFTVFGASGFIGSNLINHFRNSDIECFAPQRGDDSIYDLELNHAIYCIGLTSDFRSKPFETVQAHVCELINLIKRTNFDSFLYLSSTRVYQGLDFGIEDSTLKVAPLAQNDLYNISKIMGESICLSLNNPNIRVARLSNVFGNDFHSSNFLTSIIRDAIENKKVVLKSSLLSEKDYIHINEVVDLLQRIAISGRHQIYNVASGINTTNESIVNSLQRINNCAVEVDNAADDVIFPNISIERIQSEFEFTPSLLIDHLDKLVNAYKQNKIN